MRRKKCLEDDSQNVFLSLDLLINIFSWIRDGKQWLLFYITTFYH